MKIVASDYDGTLRQNNIISEKDMEALKLWRESGNVFAVVTGRHLSSIREEVVKYQIPYDYIICATGAIITDNKSDILYEKQASYKCLKSLFTLAHEYNSLYFCLSKYNKREWFSTDGKTLFKGNTLNDVSQLILSEDFHETGVRFKNEDIAVEFIKQAQAQLGEYISLHQNSDCVDITAKGTDKVSGLYKLLSICNEDKNNLIVVGDNHNDVDMVVEFGGYAISSGKESLLKVAKKSADNISDIILANLY